MQPFLAGFADELVKTSSDDQDGRRRNYLASALLGAIAVPAVKMFGKRIEQLVHNAAVSRAIRKAESATAKEALRGELWQGKMFGPNYGMPASHKPLMPSAELLSRAGAGALGGSAVQYLRDSAIKDHKSL